MKKNISLASWKKRAWKVFSQYIRQRDKGTCISCGKRGFWKNMHAGHYIAGSVCGVKLYFDERNINCQCVGCNTFRHGNLAQYALALKKKYGDSILEELEADRLKWKNEKFAPEDYQTIIKVYTKKIKELRK